MRGRIALVLATLLFTAGARAQAIRPAQPPPEPQPLGLAFNAGIDVPLEYGAGTAEGEASQGEETFRSPRLSLTLRYSPPRTQLFARMTVHRYLDPARQAPWNPDFTYSFGYEDWRPGTLSVTYDNYGGNRFNPDRARGQEVTRVEQGTLSAVYRIPVPRAVEAIFVPNPDNRLSASVGVHATPRFTQARSPERGEWKKSVSFSVRNRFYRYWFVEGRAYYYPDREQQQPWDPDYTYGFGYFDWNPGRVSLQYSNYAGNRFPGRRPAGVRGTSWRDGAISVSWSHSW